MDGKRPFADIRARSFERPLPDQKAEHSWPHESWPDENSGPITGSLDSQALT